MTRPGKGGQEHAVRATAGGSGPLRGMDELHYRLARESLPNGWVLDDGCGTAEGSATLCRPGRRLVAIDPDIELIRRARTAFRHLGIELLAKQSRRLPLRTGGFDGAVSFEVLEHLGDQATYLAELSRLLRPGGTLLLSTPNRAALEPFYIRGISPINRTHISELPPGALVGMIRERGFRIEGAWTVHKVDLDGRRRHLEELQRWAPVWVPLAGLAARFRRRGWDPASMRIGPMGSLGRRVGDTDSGWTSEEVRDADSLATRRGLDAENIVIRATKETPGAATPSPRPTKANE